MTPQEEKYLAHELTIEFVRANPHILKDVLDNIPKMTTTIADIQKRFYDAIKTSHEFDNLY